MSNKTVNKVKEKLTEMYTFNIKLNVKRIVIIFLLIVIVSKLYNRFLIRDTRSSNYIIAGSFSSTSIYLLKYNGEERKLHLVHSISGYGPHIYLYFDKSNRRLYATSWNEPHLSVWSIDSHQSGGDDPQLNFIEKRPITAVSSYITSKYDLLFSVGGETGEVHQLDPSTGQIEKKIQHLSFVHQHASATQDKSWKALLNGSHAIEISSLDQVFIPHLGHNSIWMYKYDHHRKMINFLNEIRSPQPGDAPRHAVVSEDGQRLYVMTEHASRVDLYKVDSNKIIHQASSSVIDDPNQRSKYRGDTIRIQSIQATGFTNREYIFATTRSKSASDPGMLAVFEFDLKTRIFKNLIRWKTPTSGGKANAIEINQFQKEAKRIELVLTDDEVGWVSVLEYHILKNTIQVISNCLIDQVGIGASHAVWIE